MRLLGFTLADTDPISGPSETYAAAQLEAVAIMGWARQGGHELLAIRPCRDLWRLRESPVRGIVCVDVDRLLDWCAEPMTLNFALLEDFLVRVFDIHRGERTSEVREHISRLRAAWTQQRPPQRNRREHLVAAAAGRRAKADAGGYAYGVPPFGWRAEGGQLVPHLGEQQTLARAKELRAAGYTLREICQLLGDENRPPRRGKDWNSGSLSRALRAMRLVTEQGTDPLPQPRQPE